MLEYPLLMRDIFMLKMMNVNDNFLMNELYGRLIPMSLDGKRISQFTLNPNEKMKNEDGSYNYLYLGEEITFSLLSDGNVMDYDKEILLDEINRREFESVRSLRIASSHLLPKTTLLLVLANEVKSIVKYEKNNIEYIIDYGNNLVMMKKDYDKIFEYSVLESIPQHEMPYLNDAIKKFSDFMSPHIIMLLYNELKFAFGGKGLNLFNDKYFAGIHANNRYMLDLGAEFLFMIEKEKKSVWKVDSDVIFFFTLNSLARNFPISITDDDYFLYKDYKFRRLSDFIDYEPFKSELLSKNRYHKCMIRSINMLFELANNLENIGDIHLVIGKIPINNYEKLYHAWIEFCLKDSKRWIAVDYTGNLIINSDDYIRLRDAEIVRILSLSLVEELFTYIDNSCLVVDKFPLLFFAEEMLDDLRKNKSLYKGVELEGKYYA